MRERSAEEQPPKLKTYMLEMTLIKLFRNYITNMTCFLCRAFSSTILPRHNNKKELIHLAVFKHGAKGIKLSHFRGSA